MTQNSPKLKFLEKAIEIGIHEEFSSLEKIRQRYLNFNNFLLVIVLSLLFVFYYTEEESQKLISLAIGIISFSISIFLSYKKENFLSAILTVTILNLILFIPIYLQTFEPIEIFPQTLFAISSSLFLIKKNNLRIVYIICCSVIMTFLFFEYNYQLSKGIPTLITIILAIFIQNYFLIIVERQDENLNTTILKLEESNSTNKKLNNSLNRKNEELIGYTYAMNHDLKAPLNNIFAFAELIKLNKGIKGEKNIEYFSFISDSVKSMNTLVQELLTYSKVSNDEFKFQPVSLKEILDSVIVDFKYDLNKKNVTLEIDNLPIIFGNAPLLKTLFHNLLSNAIKYQPRDNKEHIPSIRITSNSDNNWNYVKIIDNGIGIKEEYRNLLFEPFKRFHNRSEYEGTGLGMSICMKVMEKLGGKIDLIKSSDRGSIFRLSFKKRTNSLEQNPIANT